MSNNKRKGNEGERELAAFLRGHGVDARRTNQFSAGTPDDADITTDLDKVFIECKRRQNAQIHDWVTKATVQAGDDKLPVVFWRKDDEYWVGIVRGSDMVKLLKLYQTCDSFIDHL